MTHCETIFYNVTTDEAWAAGMALGQANKALEVGYKVGRSAGPRTAAELVGAAANLRDPGVSIDQGTASTPVESDQPADMIGQFRLHLLPSEAPPPIILGRPRKVHAVIAVQAEHILHGNYRQV